MVGGPLHNLSSPCAETLSWFGDQPKAGDRDSIKVQSCQRLDRVRVNDRDTEKWAMAISADGFRSTRYLFVDPELHRTIRLETAEQEKGEPLMVFEELRNISVGPQSDSLFEVPAATGAP